MMVMMVVTTLIIVTSSKLSMMGIADRRCRTGRSQQRTVEHPVGHSFQMPQSDETSDGIAASSRPITIMTDPAQHGDSKMTNKIEKFAKASTYSRA
jgi:hypothetical protein